MGSTVPTFRALLPDLSPQPLPGGFVMPVHRIPRAHLDEDLVELRKTGERVVGITTWDADRYLVITEYIGESRPWVTTVHPDETR